MKRKAVGLGAAVDVGLLAIARASHKGIDEKVLVVKGMQPRDKQRTWLWHLLLIALFLGLLAGCASAGNDAGTAETEFAAVEQGSLIDSISTVGSVRAQSDVTLAFEVAGRVSQVLVAEGQQVKQGETLAQMDDANLRLQVRSAQAALDIAQAWIGSQTWLTDRPQIRIVRYAVTGLLLISILSASIAHLGTTTPFIYFQF